MSNFSADRGDHDDERPGESVHGDDDLAWREVFKEIESGLRKFLSGKLPQQADVDDCLQAVSVAMLKNDKEIPRSARKAWLYRVAANEAALWWRNKSTTDRVLEKHAETIYQVDREPKTTIETRETVDRINLAIDNLSADARRIVQMRLREEKTFQNIADELQLPLGTVLTKMRRAMQRLRDEFENDDDAR